jgi:tRNA(fMet)-specific endonuclease VapC
MTKIMLDTSAYSGIMTGDRTLLGPLASAQTVYMSIFVLAELYAGFKGGAKEQWNRNILDRFLKKPAVQVLEATMDTAEIFAIIKDRLKKSGNPIPLNDIWIAAHAMETGSVVLTRDDHFQIIAGIRVWPDF